jgi:general secretion pathway protein J
MAPEPIFRGSARRLRFPAQRGFTLLEVLLALTLVAMIAAIVASSLQIVILTWEKGDQRLESIERTRHLLEFIEDDIRGAFPYVAPFDVPGTGTANVGAFFGDHERINFISTTPLLSADLPSTGLREVSYWVAPGKGLMLREAPLLYTDLYSEDRGSTLPVAPIVRDVKFEYLYVAHSRVTGELESSWEESWGSVEEISSATGIHAMMSFTDERVRSYALRYLPAAVRVTMTIDTEDADGHTAPQKLDPVVIPIMASQLYEADRQ